MHAPFFVLCSLLVVAAVPREAPSACLLQRESSQLQRTVLGQESRQHPKDHAKDNNHDHEKNDGHSHEDKHKDEKKNDKQESEHSEQKEKKDDSGGGHGGHHEKKDSGKEQAAEDTSLSSLRVELRLRIPISDLKGHKGPLPKFLGRLKAEFIKAADIAPERLEVLGVRGEYTDEGVSSFLLESIKESLQESPIVAKQKGSRRSIVDLEVLPGVEPSEPSPKAVFQVLQEQLGREDSPLMKGHLKDTLRGARMATRDGVEGLVPPGSEDMPSRAFHQGARLAPLALLALLCWPVLTAP